MKSRVNPESRAQIDEVETELRSRRSQIWYHSVLNLSCQSITGGKKGFAPGDLGNFADF